MKKLISVLIAFVMLFAIAACASGNSNTDSGPRGTLSVVYDHELTKQLLGYFGANQYCVVTYILLEEETDLDAITDAVALLKDEAAIERLKAKGWTEAEYWTDAQKETNAGMFGFTVLNAPQITDTTKAAGAILSGWLIGDAKWEKTVRHTAGGCSCKYIETVVTLQSDAPALAKSEAFRPLVNP